MRCEKCKAPMYNHGRKMACVKCGRILLLKPRRVLQEGGLLQPSREDTRRIREEAGW